MITGDAGIDAISRAGLTGLSHFLSEKTALEPGEPAGVNLEQDELAFYPLIYWPIDANAAMPSPAAIAAHRRIYEGRRDGPVRYAR